MTTQRRGPAPTTDIGTLLDGYRSGRWTPTGVLRDVADTLDRRGDDGVWITTVTRADLLARAAELEAEPDGPDRLPLYGVPFAVKDSLHVAGLPTTLACPAYATVATTTAAVVQLMLDAGAVLVGKTNLDQFATGLNGTRTPYGPPLHSVYGPELISGGSSSGSALAVATGQVPVAVATDTAGSGRVPAALNGILGFKPSRGLISTHGLVPACRSLDCVSLMATTVDDLGRVLDVVAVPDARDPWTRERAPGRTGALRIGLPDLDELVFGSRHLGTEDAELRAAHERACAALPAIGPITPVPLTPFLAAGDLLYAGPWVAERTAEFGDFLAEHPHAALPVVADIVTGGARWSAVDAFRASYRLAELRAEVDRLFTEVDVVVLPTVALTPSPAQVHAEPITTNTDLGTYTHCGNLLDLCAVVVPAGTTTDGRPVSLMVLGPPLADDTVLAVARRLTGAAAPAPPTGDPGRTTLTVAGHHLSGGPRNTELTARGGRLVSATTTAGSHRLLRVETGHGPVPALLPAPTGGPVEVEVWSLPSAALPDLLAGMPDVLVLGRVDLADGSTHPGLVCAPDVATGSRGLPVQDITASGGWRAHLAEPAASSLRTDPPPPHDAPGEPGDPMTSTTVPARPGPFELDPARTALLVIDMQRDFLLPGGFGESLGNDVGQLAGVVPPLTRLLAAARAAGLLVVHTREGHLPDLSDLPPAKHRRGLPSLRIGDPGPYGRILVRGEFGHDIVDELAPAPGEPVVDKPGKGAFYATDLHELLTGAGITSLLVTGVTTEVCVHTTVREANDRGYEALVVSDCVGSYFPEFQRVGLEMIAAQGGILGWVADSAAVVDALAAVPTVTW